MPTPTNNTLDLSQFKKNPAQAPASTSTPMSNTPLDLSQFKKEGVQEKKKPSNNNLFQDIAGGIFKSVIAKPAIRMTDALALLATSKASPETQARVEEYVNKPKTFNFGSIFGEQTIEPAPDVTTQEGRKKITGETLENAVNIVPGGAVEKAVGTGFARLGMDQLVPKFSNLLTKTAPLPAYGYGSDVASNLQDGQNEGSDFAPGMGTAVTSGLASIPFIGKFLGSTGKMTTGFTTGVGDNIIQEAFDASREGGDRLKSFKEMMRSQGNEERLVNEARDALATMRSNRTEAYKESMKDVYQGSPFKADDVKPILDTVRKGLEDFKVGIGSDGKLDFSRSTLRFNREGQADVENIYRTLANFGTKADDFTVEAVDNLKQALGDLYSPSGKARAFVQSVKQATRDVLSKAKGYDDMAGDYEAATTLIDDITRGLSLSDKVQTDTAFRKLATTLRTNNEIRKQFVDALDEIAGGNLTSKIAGQQLSNKLPRGLVSQLGTGAGALIGIQNIANVALLAKILPVMAASSPRLVGEVVSILGRAMGGVDKVFRAFQKAGMSVPKTPGDLFNQRPLESRARSSAIDSTYQTKSADSKNLSASSIPDILQPSKNMSSGFADVESMVKVAPEAKKHIDTLAETIASKTGNRIATTDPKTLSSAVRKANDEYDGDFSKLQDLARNTIILDTPTSYNKVIDELQANGATRVKVQDLPTGYKGTIVNVSTPNGLVAEVQVVTPRMLFGKLPEDQARRVLGDDVVDQIIKETGREPGLGHLIYEEYRELPAKERLGKVGEELRQASVDYYKDLQ